MRWRDFYIISSCILSFLFSILVLIPGCNKHVLNQVTIATYRYSGNYTIIYPPENQPLNPSFLANGLYEDDFHEWFFSVHYLSICAGYMGGTEDPEYIHLNCSTRPGSFTFATDDKFILDYQSDGDLFPVVGRDTFDTFNLRPPFVTLVIGIIFIVLSMVVLVYELCTRGRSRSLSLVPVGPSSIISVVLVGTTSTFLLISSSLITAIILRSNYDTDIYNSWTNSFIGLSWTGVGFMYLAFVIKLSDFVVQKEKRRRLLHTGQI